MMVGMDDNPYSPPQTPPEPKLRVPFGSTFSRSIKFRIFCVAMLVMNVLVVWHCWPLVNSVYPPDKHLVRHAITLLVNGSCAMWFIIALVGSFWPQKKS